MRLLGVLCALIGMDAVAHPMLENFSTKPVLADLQDLKALNIPILVKHPETGIGYAVITPEMQLKLQIRSHQIGKCGGFEQLDQNEVSNINTTIQNLNQLGQKMQLDLQYTQAPFKLMSLAANPEVVEAVSEVSEDNLRAYVNWFSSFPNRYNKGKDANTAVTELKMRLESMLSESSIPHEVEFVKHSSTPQYSIRVRLIGKSRPQEIVVLGGHLDSIVSNGWGGGSSDIAPGADDNASGSSNLIEALRIVMMRAQPERTIEFFWYAGEESGLLGSAEIAKQYKADRKEVIGALQLDMTLFPGSGAGTIGLMTDFTSSWLRDFLKEINRNYVNANMVEDKCGYGCSDHASWYRQGFPSVVPFESTMNKMNKNIHTKNDIVSPQLNFKHSALFSKLAVAYAMELANSTLTQPY